jgi:hypothetical protein
MVPWLGVADLMRQAPAGSDTRYCSPWRVSHRHDAEQARPGEIGVVEIGRGAGPLGPWISRGESVLAELSRLWVAVRRRHSDLTADLPRREKLLAPRFDLTWPKTGSAVPWRLR